MSTSVKRACAVASVIIVSFVITAALPASAQQSLAEHVAEGCKAELATYCSQVTPGQSRVLACIYAHNDKLSG